jgi:hypothetical protein
VAAATAVKSGRRATGQQETSAYVSTHPNSSHRVKSSRFFFICCKNLCIV